MEVTTETPEEKAFFESKGETAPPAEEKITDPPAEKTPAPEKVAEKPVEDKKLDGDPKKEPSVVPLSALHEARAEQKRLREQLEERASRMEAMEKRFMQLMERVAPEKPAQVQDPDVEADPIAALKALQAQTRQREQREREQQQHHAAATAFQTKVAAREVEFAKEVPDYGEAVQHLASVITQTFRAMGQPEHELPQAVQGYLASIAQGAVNRGADPARAAYEIAKTVGYAGKKAEPKVEEKPKADPDAKVDNIAKGQQAAKSLSSGNGAQEPPLTLEALAEMDDDDFDKNWDKVMRKNRPH